LLAWKTGGHDERGSKAGNTQAAGINDGTGRRRRKFGWHLGVVAAELLVMWVEFLANRGDLLTGQ